jgi:hypothetical protein
MSQEKPLTIVSLESQNVKRISAVTIYPKGNSVIIGGNNENGKTSVLDSISMALGGKDAICEMPLRKGTKKGHTILDLGEFTVKRTFTENGGGTLVVENKDGFKANSPQALLDGLTGKLTFDPLEFSRMKPKDQLETLRQLVGVDTTEIDDTRKKTFEQRTLINRDVDRAKAERQNAASAVEGTVRPKAAPDLEALTTELQTAQIKNRKNAAARQNLSLLNGQQENAMAKLQSASEECQRQKAQWEETRSKKINVLTARVAELEQLLEEAESSLRITTEQTFVLDNSRHLAATKAVEEIAARVKTGEEYCANLSDIDETAITDRIKNSSAERDLFAKWEALDAADKKQKAAQAQSDMLTLKLEEIDKQKRETISTAKYPVEGLELADGGVMLNGIPFSQVSEAQKLKVSVAMGFALNPRLRILLIRDGSLLDESSLAVVGKMAEEAGGQVWIERVGKGAECQVIIEDGMVEETPEKADEPELFNK